MSIDKARIHLKKYGLDKNITEHSVSSATVPLAAKAVGCSEGEIGKSLTFKDRDENPILVVVAGDVKIDNKKYKAQFQNKAKMLTPDEVVEKIGHEIGGVCPFGIEDGVKVYLDYSLKKYEYIHPACGSSNSSVKLTIDELYMASNSIGWVDIAKED